ncbi:hypothetical protein HU200_029048 [Digitaria exilis]|uniref:F-box domain-containing protein n=1 Tax=Digitaria exilis TaxID=1010633 RepID=A0A835BR63_9POAL|nr:hypothetical protein HU200_029048 [Digitaria exilis]
MESDKRRQHTGECPPVGETSTTSTVHDVPDHVLELILLRLDASACLVRAASACKRWCRVVAGAGFLKRFRLLHVPVMGYYHNYSDLPVFQVPASMSLDFLPEIDGTWMVIDSRNGILLVQNRHKTIKSYDVDPDLAVCEPLTWQYKTIRMPEPLRRPHDDASRSLGLFLSSGGMRRGEAAGRRGGHHSSNANNISLSNFKIIDVLLTGHMAFRSRVVPAASVYRSSHGGWRLVTCGWKKGSNATVLSRDDDCFAFAGRANGSLYWTSIQGLGRALVVEEATARVSLEHLPVSIERWSEASAFRVLGSECGSTLRAVCLVGDYLSFYARRRGGEWVFQTNANLRLPQDIRGALWLPEILAAHETCVLVASQGCTRLLEVDLKTMAVERVRKRVDNEWPVYAYEMPWPPTLKAQAPLRV